MRQFPEVLSHNGESCRPKDNRRSGLVPILAPARGHDREYVSSWLPRARYPSHTHSRVGQISIPFDSNPAWILDVGWLDC